jgi:hypothetical protein
VIITVTYWDGTSETFGGFETEGGAGNALLEELDADPDVYAFEVSYEETRND